MRIVDKPNIIDLTVTPVKRLKYKPEVISLLEGNDEHGDFSRASKKPKHEVRVISLLDADNVDALGAETIQGKIRNISKKETQLVSLLDAENVDALEVRRFNAEISIALKYKAETMWKKCDEESINCAPVGLRKMIIRRAMDSIINFEAKISAENCDRVKYVGNTFRPMVRGV